MQLEFEYLSLITGDPKYAEKTRAVTDYVLKMPLPPNGLYPNYLHPEKGTWGASWFPSFHKQRRKKEVKKKN